MNIIFMFLSLSSFICIAIGIFILYKDRKSPLNRIFFAFNISIAIYAIGLAFMIVAPDKNHCVVWTKIFSIGAYSFASLALHFFLIYTEKNKLLKKWWIYIVIYLPFIVFLYPQIACNIFIEDYIHTQYGWVVINRTDSMIYILFNLQYLLYCGIGMFLMHLRLKNETSSRKRKQIKIIMISASSTILVSTALSYFLTFNHNIPNFSPIVALIWSIGILYGIVKYKLMIITPAIASDQIFQTITESIVIVNTEFEIINENNATRELLNYTNDELIGQHFGILFSGDNKFSEENIKSLFEECPIQDMGTYFVSKNNKNIPVMLSVTKCSNDEDDLLGFIAVSRDITNIKEAEERLHYLAHHDILTNLPNRLLFVDRFNQEVAKAQRNKTHIAVFLLDLDHFKEVNDTFGHDIGDQLLIEVANRLTSSIRKCDSIARLGGDEFVLLISGLIHTNDFEVVVNKILHTIALPYIIEGNKLNVTASIGVSIYPVNGTHLDSLLKNADLAMYEVKDSGKNNYQIFTSVIGSTFNEKMNFESDLKNSLANNEILLYYQPIVDLYSESIIGVEALVRWDHPEYGVIEPDDFIPLAEENGYILALGEWVLKTACTQAMEWQIEGFQPLYISINFSSLQFKQKNIVDIILDVLEKTKFSPEYLLIEIKESNIIKDRENVINILEKLHDYKVMAVIDGFEVGYSSLLYLKGLPVYAIKIDRFFIRNIVNDPSCATIIKTIILLAHDLNLKVIAEGIETPEQLSFMRSLEWKLEDAIKCDSAQGFLFSDPLDRDSMTKLLKNR